MKTPLYILCSQGIKVNLHVQPGASSTATAGLLDGRLKLRLSAKAVDGKANRALIDFLSQLFAVPKSCISITHGISSREKTVLIAGDQKTLVDKLHHLCREDDV